MSLLLRQWQVALSRSHIFTNSCLGDQIVDSLTRCWLTGGHRGVGLCQRLLPWPEVEFQHVCVSVVGSNWGQKSRWNLCRIFFFFSWDLIQYGNCLDTDSKVNASNCIRWPWVQEKQQKLLYSRTSSTHAKISFSTSHKLFDKHF